MVGHPDQQPPHVKKERRLASDDAFLGDTGCGLLRRVRSVKRLADVIIP
jgi:hypothetical protein